MNAVERLATRRLRADVVNEMVGVIAGRGRRFFAGPEGRVARMEVDDRGRCWWVEEHRGRRIFTHHPGRWRGFGNGGTLRNVVERFRDYVMSGTALPSHLFGPWPAHFCDGDLWGYGAEAMAEVRVAAVRLGLLPDPAPAQSGDAAGGAP